MVVNQKSKQREKIHPNRIYLDYFSMYNQMYNEYFLTYAREVNNWLFGHFNVGTTSTNKKSRVGSIECWINKEGVANIFIIPNLE